MTLGWEVEEKLLPFCDVFARNHNRDERLKPLLLRIFDRALREHEHRIPLLRGAFIHKRTVVQIVTAAADRHHGVAARRFPIKRK